MATCIRKSQILANFWSFHSKYTLITWQTTIKRLDNAPRCFYFTTQPSKAEQSDEEAVLKKRNKSKMRDHTRALMDANAEMPQILYDYQVTPRYKAKLYGKFGRASGINPGILWPTKEKVESLIEHEKEFEPELKQMMDDFYKAEREKKEAIIARERQLDKNMLQLDKWVSDLKARKQKKLDEIRAQQEKKERLIEEVRQYFGYRLLPKDPKFQEIIEKKEKEEKKALKEAKKKERFAKEMARLSSMAQTGMAPTAESVPPLEPSPADTSSPSEDTHAKEK